MRQEGIEMHVLVFANGEIGDLDRVWRHVATVDLILCANGGSRHACALGLCPDAVIGDMDSLPDGMRTELEATGARFVTFPSAKDETDLELALLYAADQGATRITVLGARGGRIDHELGNLLLLVHPRLKGIDVRVLAGDQEITLVRREAVFDGVPGDLLSLLPIGGDVHRITTYGLAYPLNDEPLLFGPARGVSNVFTVSQPSVRLESGVLLAVHTHCTAD
jgi:thiamine pyrophosphokinase